MTAGPALAAVAVSLDISEALVHLGRNDLLPPRLEDKVAGQLRDGFIATLEASLADGSYRPAVGDTVMVPKQRFASRPATLLSLADRVVYAALVARAGRGIAKILDAPERVLWPRAEPAPKRWRDFEREPLAVDPTHVLMADVAGFYESVAHPRLRSVLISCTGNTPLSDAIVEWLGVVMGQPRGLPQGYAASDHLATAYLAEADASIARAGLLLHRHGDDIRVPVHSFDDGLRAAHVVEQALRRCQLLPNSSKLVIETVEGYRADLGQTDQDSERLRDELREAASERILAAGEDDDVYAVLRRAGIDVDGAGGYADTLGAGMDDLSDLAELTTPTSAEHAWAMLDDAMLRRPGLGGANALKNGHFHERVVAALPVLASERYGQALIHCPALLTRHGDETMTVCGYLAAMAVAAPDEVQKICLAVLDSDSFMLGWQRAWLWQTLAGAQTHRAFPDALPLALTSASTDNSSWLERVEAVKLLAAAQALKHELALSLWERAPEVYQADLIAAAALTSTSDPWAGRFLATARQHPVNAVVRTNLKASTVPERPADDAATAFAPDDGSTD